MTSGSIGAEAFPRERRLRTKREFTSCHRKGIRVSGSRLQVVACRSEGPEDRLGLSVPRAAGGAVVRNRIRRRIREVFRRQHLATDPRLDLSVRALPAAAEAKFAALAEEFLKLAATARTRLSGDRPPSRPGF